MVGAAGEVPLIETFEGRAQMFASYHMWHIGLPAADQCQGCTFNTGHVLELSYLHSRDGDRVFETYWTTGRGCEAMGNSYGMLDMTAYGRQEPWEDSPEGWPQPFGSGRPMSQQFRLDGRPISQWSRLAAGRSDDLGSTAVASDTHHCH